MAHPHYHAKSSAKRLGGEADDYLFLHEWMDHTKAHLGDARHRLFLHNSWGIFLGEQMFGTVFFRKSDNKPVPTRNVLEQHVLEDIGFIPTLEECVRSVPLDGWLFKRSKRLSEEFKSSETVDTRRDQDAGRRD